MPEVIALTANGKKLDPNRSLLPINLLGDRVLIRQKPKEEVLESGVIRPITTEDQYYVGTVMCVGPGFPDSSVDCEVNDLVSYHHTTAIEFYLKNEQGKEELFHIIRSSDVMAIL